MFITFEGPDGSGKTTALDNLIKFLDKNNIEYVLTREPGSFVSEDNKKIREIITNKDSEISSMTEAILFSADRREHLEKLIWPSLKKGMLVICDRYFDSTFAYQGSGRGLGIEKMIELQENITDKTYPDHTFYFDLPVEVAMERVEKRGDKNRLDNESKEFVERVHKGYKYMIDKDPKRFVIINAAQTEKKVYEDVLAEFKKKVLKEQ